MFDTDIISVWGTADNFRLSFSLDKRDGLWKVGVPPDLTDGTYAVELFAKNKWNLIAHWTGFLYMHSGRVCLHLNKERYTLWFDSNETKISFIKGIEINYEGSCIHGCKM